MTFQSWMIMLLLQLERDIFCYGFIVHATIISYGFIERDIFSYGFIVHVTIICNGFIVQVW